jgi:hypothetical protein
MPKKLLHALACALGLGLWFGEGEPRKKTSTIRGNKCGLAVCKGTLKSDHPNNSRTFFSLLLHFWQHNMLCAVHVFHALIMGFALGFKNGIEFKVYDMNSSKCGIY